MSALIYRLFIEVTKREDNLLHFLKINVGKNKKDLILIIFIMYNILILWVYFCFEKLYFLHILNNLLFGGDDEAMHH